MIGVKRKHPEADSFSDPSPKRWKPDEMYDTEPCGTPPYPVHRKKYRVKRSRVIVQVLDLGDDVRMVQKIYRGIRTFF